MSRLTTIAIAVSISASFASFAPRAFAADPPAAAVDPAPAAQAPEVPAPRNEEPKWQVEPAARRSGFVVGAMLGFGLSSIVGYPNDVKKIGLARYYTATGAVPASSSMLFFGGALSDWFTFGVGFGGSRLFGTGDNTAMAAGFAFHVEAYPLYFKGGKLRDLGVMLDAGTGSASVAPTADDTKKLVDSGGSSMLGGGVFYDGLRFWRVGSGPYLAGAYQWSDSVRRPAIFFGYRIALATGSVTGK
jgi:hypothetical protein